MKYIIIIFIMPSLVSLIKICDFISSEPKLKISQKTIQIYIWWFPKHFLSSMLFLAFIIYFLLDLLNRNSLKITYNQEIDDNSFVNMTGAPIFFDVYDLRGQAIKPDGIYPLTTTEFTLTQTWINNTKTLPIKIKPIKMVNCLDYLNYTQFEDLKFQTADLENKFCYDQKEDLSIKGVYGSPTNQSFLTFTITPCVNSTQNNNNCKSDEIKRQTLNKVHYPFSILIIILIIKIIQKSGNHSYKETHSVLLT